MTEQFYPSNDHETPGDSEITYLRVAKQLEGQPEIAYLRERQLREQRKAQPNVVPPGRPYFVAHIPDPLEFEDMRKRFYDIMINLTYREAMAWCRGFGYSYTTYLMRRYQHRKPKMEEVIITIGWYDIGKPVMRKNHTSIASFERLLEGLKEQTTRGSSAPGPSTSLGAEHPP